MNKQVLKKIAIGLCLSFSLTVLHVIISAPALAEADFTAPATEPGEMSRGMAFDGENFLVAIRGDQSHGGRIAAQLISKEGTPVSSRIDIGRSGWIPGVAFDGDNYLMIWEDGDSEPANLIYGQFISKSGSLVGGPFPISTAPGAIDPACAISFNGTAYVVAWNDATAEGACGYVRFRSVTKAGALGDETMLSADPGCYPCISSGRGTSLVVWNSGAAGVLSRVIDSSGSPIGPATAMDSEAQATNRPIAGSNPLSAVSALSLTVSQDGLAVTLTAGLLADASPVKGKSVLFYDQLGAGSFAAKGTATTNDSGIAVKKFNTTLGQHTAYAKFNASGDMSAAQSVNVTYTIAKVTLDSPVTGYVSPTPTPDLSWQAYDGASQYHVQVSTSALFGAATCLVDADTGNTNLVYSIPSPGLAPGKTYYWRVRAYIPNGKTLYSDKRKIMFKPPVNLVLEKVGVNGSTITFKATLTRVDNGELLAGKTIAFYEKTEDGAFVLKGTAKTGSLISATPGVATKSWTTQPGNHQAYAMFKGDVSYASNSTDPEATIYIIYPPVTFDLPATLSSACQGVPYHESVADTNVAGGIGPPYHFELATMGGFPPMGIILNQDGTLTGTPTGTTSKFKICAVDLGGNSSCKLTTIPVRTDCNPAVTGTWVGTYSLSFNTILCDGGWVGYEDGSATVYLQQIGTTVTGTIITQFNDWYCISDPTNRTGHLKGRTLGSNGIDFNEIQISDFVFPSYFIYINDFDIYVWNGPVDFRLIVTKQ
jgi:hypothetical protein